MSYLKKSMILGHRWPRLKARVDLAIVLLVVWAQGRGCSRRATGCTSFWTSPLAGAWHIKHRYLLHLGVLQAGHLSPKAWYCSGGEDLMGKVKYLCISCLGGLPNHHLMNKMGKKYLKALHMVLASAEWDILQKWCFKLGHAKMSNHSTSLPWTPMRAFGRLPSCLASMAHI